jgi:hypothetical protein
MKITAVVDRFEGDKAVLLLADETKQTVFPRVCLPLEAKEGDHLTVTIEIDEARTQEAQAEADSLLAELMK